MWSLIFSHDMLGFIDGSIKQPRENINVSNTKYLEWKRSDVLVQGWIFGSLSEGVMKTVVNELIALQVWLKLRNKYGPVDRPSATATISKDRNNKGFNKYIPLRRAIQMGDWKQAQEFINRDKDALTAKLNLEGHRALHFAIRNHKNIPILENLLNQINPELLPTLVDRYGLTVLQYAVTVNNSLAVQKLVEKNPSLLFNYGASPLKYAAVYSDRITCLYLVRKCKEHISLVKEGHQNPFDSRPTLHAIISAGYIDVAYELLKDYPKLAGENRSDFGRILYSFAQKSDAYPSAKRYNFYQKFVYTRVPANNYSLGDTCKFPDIENQETKKVNHVKWKSCIYIVAKKIIVKFWDVLLHVPHIKHLHEEKVEHNSSLAMLKFISEEAGKLENRGYETYEKALMLAMENNIPEVIEHITGLFPESLKTFKDKRYSLLQLSVINRCENVYKFLVPEIMYNSDLREKLILWHDFNNILHLAGKLAPLEKLNMVTGAALQMQRELQWFQEVNKLLQPNERTQKNAENETPSMVFRKEHEDLRQKGEEWMKKAADSYTITAALIITIVFAAAITVPGGNNQDTGKAIYKTKPSFIIFIVSDAISLFTSTTSLLMFLSILTARYSYEDFLYKLPKRLIFGLVMLFLSVTTMLIAFGSTLYIMSGQDNLLILVPIAALTCLPIASFVTLQLPLLADLISSTYGHGYFRERSELSCLQSHED
ncbi:uncharacterized protein LOC143612000 [Bidens hawaiensis]|uniref:uncharacterized protein LOC143612000 n=1 Tax=Bidens hawaiensis TaxID=980011 RepID=UPI00404A6761